MKSLDTELKVAIAAQNMANMVANKIGPELLEIFKTLVGCKVLKKDNSLLASVKKLLPKFPEVRERQGGLHLFCHVYSSDNAYSRAWTAKACVSGEIDGYSYCVYRKTSMYIVDFETFPAPGIVSRVYDLDKRKTDYDYKTVKGLQRIAKQAQEAADKAKSACFPFN